MSIIQTYATVKSFGKPVKSKYNESMRHAILFRCDNGQEETIWKDTTDPMTSGLQPGMRVILQGEGNKRNIVPLNAPAPQMPQAPSYQTPAYAAPAPTPPMPNGSNNAKGYNPNDVKAFIENQAKTFKYIYDKVAAEFDNYALASEDIKTISTTIYIQTHRKFEL